MNNHFHLVFETPRPNRVAGMKWLLHYGEEIAESVEAKAEGIVAGGLRKLKWTGKDLETQGEPGNVRMARRLRQETTMTLKWIAQRLRMGSWTHAANRKRSIRH
jgi:hypothetical protein